MASNSNDTTFDAGSTTTGDTPSSARPGGSSTLGSSGTYGSTHSGTGEVTRSYSSGTTAYSEKPIGNYGKRYRPQSSESLMEKARDNKTGIAVAVAVGAFAAAAIPFLFSSKRKSSARPEGDTSMSTYRGNRDRYDTGGAQAACRSRVPTKTRVARLVLVGPRQQAR